MHETGFEVTQRLLNYYEQSSSTTPQNCQILQVSANTIAKKKNNNFCSFYQSWFSRIVRVRRNDQAVTEETKTCTMEMALDESERGVY